MTNVRSGNTRAEKQGTVLSPERRVRIEPAPTRGTGLVSFSGHETFTLRHGWLKKALDAVGQDAHIFTKDNAMVELGVGKNMVRSIRHWALAADVLSETSGTRGNQLEPTKFGTTIFGPQGCDPFLEDLNTIWLIHWKLATNERRSTGWSWMFSLMRADDFTRESLFELFTAELKKRTIEGPSTASLERDIDCALRTYVGTRSRKELLEDSLECPLVELQLIGEDSDGRLYHFGRGPKSSLSSEIFTYCLLEFWNAKQAQDSLAFSEIAYSQGSPGAVFKLDENSLASHLEQLERTTSGALIYDETAGLKQVYKRSNIDAHRLLIKHYERSLAKAGD